MSKSRWKRLLVWMLGGIMLFSDLFGTGLTGTVRAESDRVVYKECFTTDGTEDNAEEGYLNLMDDDSETKWVSSFDEDNIFVEFNSTDPIIPKGYILTTADDAAEFPEMDPVSWVIYGKLKELDDWQTLATVTDDTTIDDKNSTDYSFDLENDDNNQYQYFRMEIKKLKGTGDTFQLAEFGFVIDANDLGGVTVVGIEHDAEYQYDKDYAVDLDYTLEDHDGKQLEEGRDYTAVITDDSGNEISVVKEVGEYILTIRGKGSYKGCKVLNITVKQDTDKYTGLTVLRGSSGASDAENCENLFDEDEKTDWCVADISSAPAFVEFQSSMPIIPLMYYMTTGSDTFSWRGRNPSSWVIKAKLNKYDEWTEIVKVSNDNTMQGENSCEYEFEIQNEKSMEYRYFRLEVSKVKSGTCLKLSDFRFGVAVQNRDLNYASVSGLEYGYAYNGGLPVDLGYAVKDYNQKTLVKDRDYKCVITKDGSEVDSVIDMGEYILTITGTGIYKGSIEKAFQVKVKTLGAGEIGNPDRPAEASDQWSGSFVYFGKNGGDPVRYRVLSSNTVRFSEITGIPTMLLDCDEITFQSVFDSHSAVWADSQLRQELNEGDESFLHTSFEAAEQEAIAKSTISGHPLKSAEQNDEVCDDEVSVAGAYKDLFGDYVPLNEDKVFLLDGEDLYNSAYGYGYFTGSSNTFRGKGAEWWLRSKSRSGDNFAGYVDPDGGIYDIQMSSDKGVSPAINIDLSHVLFSSQLSEDEYKLTISDNEISVTINEGKPVMCEDERVNVPYTLRGENAEFVNRIRLIITDGVWTDGRGWSEGAEIKYHGEYQITEGEEEHGVASFMIPDYKAVGSGKSWHAYIIAEMINDGFFTDYASVPLEVSILYDQKVKSPVAIPGLIYTGIAQPLVTPAVVEAGNNTAGSVLYSLDGKDWSASLPAGTNAGSYSVYYKVAGNEDYKDFICVSPVNVTITKGTPAYTLPDGLKAVVGQTLKEVVLPAGWTWDDETLSVGEAGVKKFASTFTPEDTANYNTVNTEISVTVTAADTDHGPDDRNNPLADSRDAVNPIPEIDAEAASQWLYLVKGQKFTDEMLKGWTVDEANRKNITVSKKGAVNAKKATEKAILTSPDKKRTVSVNICQPSIEKKLKLEAGVSGNLVINNMNDKLPVLWVSSNPDAATVDQNGHVTATAKGKAVITAYINGKAYKCNVTVTETVAAASRVVHLNINDTKKITLKGVKMYQWTVSENNGVVAFRKGNKIKGLKAGTVSLNATEPNSGKQYTATVYVEDITIKTDGITAGKKNKYTLKMKAGETKEIRFANVHQPVLFKSSKPQVAYETGSGVIKAKKKGKTKLTTKINGKTVTINVVVE